jgi:dipeptidyl aminopeptidase/acylaminoacyl peptidase
MGYGLEKLCLDHFSAKGDFARRISASLSNMQTFSRWISAPLSLALVVVTVGFGQEKPAAPDGALKFPTNEQMRHYRAIGNPRLSPDGMKVLVQISDTTADGAKSHLWLVDVGGGEARQLTYSPTGDKRGERGGEWMPDGQSILFLAKRGEHTALFRLPMNGGEAKEMELKVPALADESKLPGALPTPAAEAAKEKKAGEKVEPVGDSLPIDVGSFRVSPDGKTIALIANDPQTPGEKKQKDAKADAEWVDHGLHRTRLYLLSVASMESAAKDGAGKDATAKLTLVNLPMDVRGGSWSADSTKLVVDAEEPNGVDELGPAGSTWVVMASDPAHPAKVEELPKTAGGAVWSKDGTEILYEAQAKRDAPPGYGDVYVYTVATKAIKNLTDGFTGSVGRGEPLALADGGVLEGTEEGVEAGLVRYSADGKMEAVKLPVAAVGAVETNAAQNGWVFVGSSGGLVTELLYSAKLGDAPKVLPTPALAPKGVKTEAPKRISWKNEKQTIDGMLYLPPEAASGKVPLVVEVHGGPLGSYVDSYSIFTDFLLAHGWAVLRTNPRGSTGRGAEFAAANKNDLGGADYRDIMAGVDFVLKTEPIDGDKLALMGYSYGGEMAAFVETKTARFKAIVSAAPVIDQNSEYGTERGSWYDQWYYGKPWLHEADAWRQSPISGAAQAKTPFMLLQGEDDTTDPLGQSLEMYHALRQMGVPVELITYPRVDHGPLGGAIYGSPSPEPWHGFDARQRVVEFISKGFGAVK